MVARAQFPVQYRTEFSIVQRQLPEVRVIDIPTAPGDTKGRQMVRVVRSDHFLLECEAETTRMFPIEGLAAIGERGCSGHLCPP